NARSPRILGRTQSVPWSARLGAWSLLGVRRFGEEKHRDLTTARVFAILAARITIPMRWRLRGAADSEWLSVENDITRRAGHERLLHSSFGRFRMDRRGRLGGVLAGPATAAPLLVLGAVRHVLGVASWQAP